MNCPKCYEPLRISDRQGIEIDYCPECRGVWLDRGELDKIIERTLRTDLSRPSYDAPDHESHRGRDSEYYHKKKYKKKKVKHVLEEIFDFFD